LSPLPLACPSSFSSHFFLFLFFFSFSTSFPYYSSFSCFPSLLLILVSLPAPPLPLLSSSCPPNPSFISVTPVSLFLPLPMERSSINEKLKSTQSEFGKRPSWLLKTWVECSPTCILHYTFIRFS
jgi:hypothetical protein